MEAFETTKIILFGYTITEPVTALTNLLLALLCWRYTYEHQKNLFFKRKLEFMHWRNFFFFMGSGVFLGIFTHGGKFYMDANQYLITWVFMQILTGISIYHVEKAIAKRFFSQDTFNIVSKISLIKVLIFIPCAIYFQSFMTVVFNSGIGFLSIMVICIIYLNRGRTNAIKMIVGILFGIVAAVLHVYKIGFNEWFNHNDFNHILMAMSLYYFYQFSITVRLVEGN